MTLPEPPPIESPLKLADFDLDATALSQIITDAHVARQAVGPNFPRNARGLIFYFHVVSGLRSHLLTKPGWQKTTIAGLEFVEHKGKGLRLGYLAGNDGTGHPERELKSAHARGDASEQSTKTNLQLCMNYPVEFYARRRTDARGGENRFQEWFVAVNRESAQKYMVEIALPVEINKGGHFVGWAHRLFVGEIPLDSEPLIPKTTTTASAKPTVRRKRKKSDDDETGNEGVG